jgi:sulfur-carrier protein
MPFVKFAPHLQRHVACPPQHLAAGSLASVLDNAFHIAPALRSYVLDDQGAVRKHVAIFINGTLIRNRSDLTLWVNERDNVDIIQALSGG